MSSACAPLPCFRFHLIALRHFHRLYHPIVDLNSWPHSFPIAFYFSISDSSVTETPFPCTCLKKPAKHCSTCSSFLIQCLFRDGSPLCLCSAELLPTVNAISFPPSVICSLNRPAVLQILFESHQACCF